VYPWVAPAAADASLGRKAVMRVLATADVHGVRETYSWLEDLARMRRPDAVVLAGDLLGGACEAPTIEEAHAIEARALVEVLARFDCPVLYIMGNDDMVELPPHADHVIPIHARRWEGRRFGFVGYQYTLPFMGGIFEKPESAIEEDLRPLSRLIDEATVLVTHSPAYGILDVGILDRHAGSTSILSVIEERRPRAHIHGHVHQGAGRQDRHFNVAAAGRRRAVLLDLETLEDEVLVAG
jgi:Icc-related predicted phosphoesterase